MKTLMKVAAPQTLREYATPAMRGLAAHGAVKGGLKGGAGGALIGGALNAARQHRKNKKDPENKKSLLGAAAKGGAVGGAVGGTGGAGVGAVKGVGRYLRGKAYADVFKDDSLDPDKVWAKVKAKKASFTGHELTNKERLDALKVPGYHGFKRV